MNLQLFQYCFLWLGIGLLVGQNKTFYFILLSPPSQQTVTAAAVSATECAYSCYSQKRYRAVYDYAAADEDEVSFMDGDVIVDVQQIDEGWMYGRVERTGQQGMLPANYVEAMWMSGKEREREKGGGGRERERKT